MIERLPHRSPTDRCTCPPCETARLIRLRRLSPAQRRALAAIDARIPRHVDDLRRRGIRWRTLCSLMQNSRTRSALVHQLDLRQAVLDAPYYAFALLTVPGTDLVATGRKAGVL